MVQAMPVSVGQVDAAPSPMVVVQEQSAAEESGETAAAASAAAAAATAAAAFEHESASAGVAVVTEKPALHVEPTLASAPSPTTVSQQKQFFTSSPTPWDSAVDSKCFKPIRVDNWGIFLLTRLQSYFQKKEFCDLTIRFPSRNAQIKVHSLVVNSCTDFFAKMEREGRVVEGVLNLPEEFGPDAVAPVIRFMYTGRLDIKTGMFSRLKKAAELLEMAVLTKLMEAQLLAPPSPEHKKKRRMRPDDPLRQMKKIKKIERKFTADEKRARIAAAKVAAASDNKEQIQFVEGAIPGKKLPIWKRRSTNQPESDNGSGPSSNANGTPLRGRPANLVQVPPPPPNLSRGMVLKPISGPPPGAKLQPIRGLPVPKSARPQSDPLPKSYGSKDGGTPEKPRVPRQVREMQQNLNFEKIRRTAAKDVSGLLDKKDMSMEEISEAMAEQRHRLHETEEDDFFDNDAGLDYDEAAPEEQSEIDEPGPVNTNIIVGPMAKPILKTEPSEPTPRKSVRFSLTPTSASPSRSCPPTKSQSKPQVSNAIVPDYSPPKKEGLMAKIRPAVPAADFESTLDEFNKAIEEEEEEDSIVTPEEPELHGGGKQHQIVEKSQMTRSRSGRVIIKKSLDSKDQTLSPPAARKRGRSSPTTCAKAVSTSPPPLSAATSPSPPPAKRPRKLGANAVGAVCPDADARIDLPSAPTATAASTSVTKVPSLPLPAVKRVAAEAGAAEPAAASSGVDRAKVVEEMLKKYPNLLKEGKNVKLRVVGKDASGRSVVKHITLKAAAPTSSSTPSTLKSQAYTARRGRPKKVRVVVGDSEETELRQKGPKVIATLDQVAADATGAQQRQERPRQEQPDQRSMDPSSEAEALSHVASGIAASLGLAVGTLDHEGRVTTAPAVVVPTLRDGGGGCVSGLDQQSAVMIDYQGACAAAASSPSTSGSEAAAQVILPSGGAISEGALQILHDGSVSLTSPGVVIPENLGTTSRGATIEAAMAKLHGATSAASAEPLGNAKKKLEMDWEEDEGGEEEIDGK